MWPSRAVRCWRSTATHLPIAPTTPCRSRSAGAATKGGGAIVGFANLLLRLYQDEQPARRAGRLGHAGCADLSAEGARRLPGRPQVRRRADRPARTAAGVRRRLRLRRAKAPGYEADDFLAAAVADEERRGGTVLVASGDRDAFQLASDTTTILQPVRAGEMARIGPAEVRERYGVEPRQVPDFIALRGDPSDKLPGAKGVGPKGAAKPAAPARHARSRRSPTASWRGRRMSCGSTAGSPRWTPPPRCRRCPTRHRPGQPRADARARLGAEPPGRASRCAGAICIVSSVGK